MKVSDFDFDLPQSLIALRPVRPRDSARLLIVRAGADRFEDAIVRDLPNILKAGDILVANDTRVIPAFLRGRRQARDNAPAAEIAINLHMRLDALCWRAFAKPGRKLKTGDRIGFAPGFAAVVESKTVQGDVVLRFDASGAELDALIAAHGTMPLPPYIAQRRSPDDADVLDYQTTFAARDGAVAAPTAGLHFTPELISRLSQKGVGQAKVTLHVGAGTFLPVKTETVEEHKMHGEWGAIDAPTARALNDTRQRGGRVVAVGTTSLRLLETAAGADGKLSPWEGETAIFITPGHHFRATDWLLTNFHLPRSTLFMLVAAFCGLPTMRAAYAHAIDRGFRFYSYGDACLLMRTP